MSSRTATIGRTIDPLLGAKVVWKAIVSWLNYNAHDTPAAGVFQSPCGRIHRRRLHAGAVALATAVIVIPLGSYFPVCTVFTTGKKEPAKEHYSLLIRMASSNGITFLQII